MLRQTVAEVRRKPIDRVMLHYLVHGLAPWSNRSIFLPECLARIEGVAHGFADEDQQRQHDGDGEEAGKAEPGRLHVGFALRQQLSQRWRTRWQSESQEVQRSERH